MLLNPYRFGLPPAPLLTGLIAYWKLDEASGTTLDAHGSNDLAPFTTVGSGAGKINTARDFAGDANSFLTRVSGAALSTGDIDFTVSVWVNGGNLSDRGIVGKWGSSANEFNIRTNVNRLPVFEVSGPGGGHIVFDPTGLTLNVWNHILAWHDSTTDQIAISINNASPIFAAHAGGVSSFPAGNFDLGIARGAVTGVLGRLDEVGFWKRLLTPAERATLYNNGAGVSYPAFTAIPVAAFSGTPRTGTFPLSVTFTDASTGTPASWAWAKNNGSGWVPFEGTPNAQNPVEIFAAGTWSVRLTATNVAGSDDEQKSDFVSNLPPLQLGLVSYWKMDEGSAGAAAVDSTASGNTLASVNNVGTASGKISLARDFAPTNSTLTKTVSGDSLSTGNTSFTFAFWVKSVGPFGRWVAKWHNSGLQEFMIGFSRGYAAIWVKSGTSTGLLEELPSNGLSTGVWHFIVGWHDFENQQIGISVNNTFTSTTPWTLGVTAQPTIPFWIGSANGSDYCGGGVDEVGFWKRVLTPADRTELYNAGSGKTYPFT